MASRKKQGPAVAPAVSDVTMTADLAKQVEALTNRQAQLQQHLQNLQNQATQAVGELNQVAGALAVLRPLLAPKKA